MRRRHLIQAFAILLCLTAPRAFAKPADVAQAAPMPAAVGEWVGTISWNDPIVTYAWSISPDGAFTSGRYGRAQDGGGVWALDRGTLTLKYGDGFRYQGQLRGDDYAGDAYDRRGRRFGAFSMHRVANASEPIEP